MKGSLSSTRGGGVALRLDASGLILEVLADDIGAVPGPARSLRFDDIVHPSAAHKARSFVERVLVDGAGYGWELALQSEDRLSVVAFSGTCQEDGTLVVVGGASTYDIEQMYEDLLRVNNEQANILRQTVKQLSRVQRDAARGSSKTYEEMTALNNELAGMQRELSRKNAQLERLNADKNELLGMVAHDLRNPIGVIAGYASMMLGGLAGELSTPAQREFLTSINRASKHMLSMIEDLLDLSAIESGCIQLHRETLDLEGLLLEAVKLNRLLADHKQIRIELVSSGPLEVYVDPGKLNQVVSNLLSNAVKYSQPATTVHVDLAATCEGIVLRVRDEGQGIPAQELGGMFKPFSRTSVQSTAGEKSTGLGLAIVRKIVEAHAGRISVESEVGRGSTFTVVLPSALPAN